MKILIITLLVSLNLTTSANAANLPIRTEIAIVDGGSGGPWASGENSLHCRFWC
jgi:hypothetical protein